MTQPAPRVPALSGGSVSSAARFLAMRQARIERRGTRSWRHDDIAEFRRAFLEEVDPKEPRWQRVIRARLVARFGAETATKARVCNTWRWALADGHVQRTDAGYVRVRELPEVAALAERRKPIVGEIWLQESSGRLVEIIDVRFSDDRKPPIVEYRFLDNGHRAQRRWPEFDWAFRAPPLRAA